MLSRDTALIRNIILGLLIAAAIHGAAWWSLREATMPPDLPDLPTSLSFSPYINQRPEDPGTPPIEQIDNDLRIIAPFTRGVRTYATRGNLSEIPRLAEKYGLDVWIGLWLGREVEVPPPTGNETPDQQAARKSAEQEYQRARKDNEDEVKRAVELARVNHNVRAIIVGNEVLVRNDLTPQQLIRYIREVKQQTNVPVSTGETWSHWLGMASDVLPPNFSAMPELRDIPPAERDNYYRHTFFPAQMEQVAREVDFITAHILPYWERLSPDDSVAFAIDKVDQLREHFPGKRIVVGEFGWPSSGYNLKEATPDVIEQARIIRSFLRQMQNRGTEVNIVEAFDQPWKRAEGSVGPYWGLFYADRTPKFSFLAGKVSQENTTTAALALSLGTAITLFGLWRRRPTFGHAVSYAIAANAMAAGIAAAVLYPLDRYLTIHIWIMWGFGLVLMVPLALLTLAKVHEISEVLLGRKPQKLIIPAVGVMPARTLKVSIHVPAYREPPDMLKATIDDLAKLNYPDFEALIIVNNTPEESYWKPIEEHCAKLGPRFKFVNLPKVSGFKAGALNMAMSQMDPATDVIAVIDADYRVHPDWLRDLVPAFEDPKVALVQAPQDHRDGEESLLKRLMNAEYAGFFDIGMVQRNEDNAIVAHGTMLMVRRSAFDEVGGWGTDTITEDTELGLRLLERGYEARYTNRRYGWGLLPDTYKAFKTQRHRWAYGAMQILRKHWRHMLPRSKTLTTLQKLHFIVGWSYWLSDALGTGAAILNLLWAPMIIWANVSFPFIALTVPILTAAAVNMMHCILLYRERVDTPFTRIVGAAIAAMSLQLTVSHAVFTGLLKDNLPFLRTDKGGNAKKRRSDRPALWEGLLALGLLASACFLMFINRVDRIVELTLFAITLAVQALPFLMAVVMSTIEDLESRKPSGKDMAFADIAAAEKNTPTASAQV